MKSEKRSYRLTNELSMKRKVVVATAVACLGMGGAAAAASPEYADASLNHGPQGGTNITASDSKTIRFGDGELRDVGLYLGQVGTNVKFDGTKTELTLESTEANHSYVAAQIKTGSSVEFAARNTVIDSRGLGGSGRWGFGLLVNGGENSTARFTGDDVSIRTYTEKYTAQTLTVKGDSLIEFSNSGNVSVVAESPVSVTGVDIQGTMLVDNTGDFTVTSTILPGEQTGSINAVGMQGLNGTLTVTDRVSSFNILVTGQGVDNDGTSYSTGTMGIIFDDGSTVDIRSKNLNITVNVDKDVTDVSPEGHTSGLSHGIYIADRTKFTTGANTQTTITMTNGLGTAIGIASEDYGGSFGELEFNGAVNLNVYGEKAAQAVYVGGGSLTFNNNVTAVAGSANAADARVVKAEGGDLFINGKLNRFEGIFEVGANAKAKFQNGITSIKGPIILGALEPVGFSTTTAAAGGLDLVNAQVTVEGGIIGGAGSGLRMEDSNLTLGADSQLGPVDANGSEIIVSKGKTEISSFSGENNKLTIGDVNSSVEVQENTTQGLQLGSTGNVTDALGGDVSALTDKVKVGDGTQAPEFTGVKMQAGEVVGEVTMDSNGNVKEKVNEANDAKLNRMANMPAMVTRIQMNELRKRMGDIRSSEGETGVWARYNGGNLLGAYDLDADFNMIQFGADKALGNGLPRIGAAFSYAKTEADDLYGSVDMDAYSLSGYGIWTWDNGAFLDVIARAANVDTDMKEEGKTGSLDNWLFSLSTEIGQRAMFADTFYVEPSAEFTYTWMDGDSFTIGDIKREIGDSESLIGRFGIALGKQCPGGFGDFYVRAGLVHEFMGNASITSALTNAGGTTSTVSRTINREGSDTWVEYAVGGNINFSKNAYMYVDLERTEGAELEEDWRANVGVRYSF